MQTEEQHGEGVALRFVEYGEEIGATHEQEGSDVVRVLREEIGVTIRLPRITISRARSWSTPLSSRYRARVRKIAMVPVSRSLTMPRRKSVSCVAMLLAVAVAFPVTKQVLGI